MRSVLVSVLLLIAALSHAQVHDVSADSILTWGYHRGEAPRFPVSVPNPVIVRFSNHGLSDESSVRAVAVIADRWSDTVYRDTIQAMSIKRDATRDTSFKDFTPVLNAIWTMTVWTELAGDEAHSNDAVRARGYTFYQHDFEAVAVIAPRFGQQISQGTAFDASASFLAMPSLSYAANIPVEVEIRDHSTGKLMFRAYDTIPSIPPDSTPVTATWPSKQDVYDVSTLPVGTYQIAAIARYQTDGDRSNDTTYSQFEIVPAAGVARDARASEVIAYPNPTRGLLTIASADVRSAAVLGLLGKPVLTATTLGDAHAFSLDLSPLAPGVYWLKIEARDGIRMQRVVKW